MTHRVLLAATLLLAGCSGGDDRSEPEDTATISPLQKAERPVPAKEPETGIDADFPATADKAPAKPDAASLPVDNKTIPLAIRGRWALKVADCTARKGTDLTALTIDATNLRFYESHGELTRVRQSDAIRIVADFRFSGEGVEWDRRMLLDLADGGKTLVRRDVGEGAVAGAIRYTRCAG